MRRYTKFEAVQQGLLREWEEKEKVLEYFLKPISYLDYVKHFYPDPFIGVFPESQKGVAVLHHDDLIGALIWQRSDFYASYQVFFDNWYREAKMKEIQAVVVDLDHAKADLLAEWLGKVMPRLHVRPTAMVLSGEGLHVVFKLKEPIQYYRRYRELIERVNRQVQGKFKVKRFGWKVDTHKLIQPYRIPGSSTKIGTRARAFLVPGGRPVTFQELANWVEVEVSDELYQTLITDWGQSVKTATRRKKRKVRREEIEYLPRAHPGLYNKIFEKVLYEVQPGRRYLALCALVVAGWKAGIEYEEVKDHVTLLAEELTLKYPHVHPVRPSEVKKALKLYNPKATRVRRAVLERWLGVPLPAQKRNYLPRKAHLEKINMIRKLNAKAKAEKALQLRDKGWTNTEIANYFRVTDRTVRRWLAAARAPLNPD